MIRKFFISYPGRVLFLSVFSMVCLGTFLLYLPFSQKIPINFLDCLFTATSATCVTGTSPVQLDSFSIIGQIVILALIQIGGIGLLTITLILVSLFTNLGLATQLMFGQVLELESWKNTKKILLFIGSFTLILELLGAISIFFTIYHEYSLIESIFYSIFHSISSFCSAGISPINITNYKFNIFFLAISGFLILAGNFGFITWYEILLYFKAKLKKRKRFNISLTTKITFSTTIIIIVTTLLLLLAIEANQFSNSPWWVKLSNMIFNTIAYRSAGFSTLDVSSLHQASILLIMIICFIGSSPGSTGSGIKITTIAIFFATIQAALSNRTTVDIKKRSIPKDQVFKSVAVLSLSFGWILASTFLLLLTNENLRFLSLLFESVNSFSNLGLSYVNLSLLNDIGKIIIIISMFFGRVSSVTLILLLRSRRSKREKVPLQYPEERPMIS